MVTPRSVESYREINAASIQEADQVQARVTPTINAINSKLAQ